MFWFLLLKNIPTSLPCFFQLMSGNIQYIKRLLIVSKRLMMKNEVTDKFLCFRISPSIDPLHPLSLFLPSFHFEFSAIGSLPRLTLFFATSPILYQINLLFCLVYELFFKSSKYIQHQLCLICNTHNAVVKKEIVR